MKPRIFYIGLGLLVLGIYAILPVPIRTDYGFICENTGSRYGYTKWIFGIKTGKWSTPSSLEQFMQQRHPSQLQHRWTRYMGTERNVFGNKLVHNHERPGPIIQVHHDTMERYMSNVSDDEKLRLYEILATGNKSNVLVAVEAIFESDFPRFTPNTNTVPVRPLQ